MTRRRLVMTAGYATVAAGLAGAGATRSPAPLLIAAVLTLPAGVVAFVGVYVVYGALLTIARSFGARVMEGNGWSPHWFVVVDEVLVMGLFAAAAVVNALLVERIVGSRRAPQPASAPTGGEPSARGH